MLVSWRQNHACASEKLQAATHANPGLACVRRCRSWVATLLCPGTSLVVRSNGGEGGPPAEADRPHLQVEPHPGRAAEFRLYVEYMMIYYPIN